MYPIAMSHDSCIDTEIKNFLFEECHSLTWFLSEFLMECYTFNQFDFKNPKWFLQFNGSNNNILLWNVSILTQSKPCQVINFRSFNYILNGIRNSNQMQCNIKNQQTHYQIDVIRCHTMTSNVEFRYYFTYDYGYGCCW